MQSLSEKDVDGVIRQLLHALIETMADVAVLKSLMLATVPDGRRKLEMATAMEAAEKEASPFRDALEQLSDHELLDMLATWKSGRAH